MYADPRKNKIFLVLCDLQADLRSQLWHECVGPSVKIPCIGDRVFYFVQGHLKQVEEIMKQEGIDRIPNHGLPSKILCKVVAVQLKAEPKSEEVYAKITLRPNFDEREVSDIRTVPQKVPASFFRKVLRATDVSKDGGCGLPRKDAENTFPSLDMSQDTASQEIVAKDLHGSTWSFQHTYRRSQNRHTLINGWGKFVREKKLREGDAVFFLRFSLLPTIT
ncbi:auxin response factor 11-like [Bidens hawaiensis]|uniref:auxin response factor 11-like n=1 Tax=Bidens hawaiensis TaxID=980011 RepID=UPI00404903CF